MDKVVAQFDRMPAEPERQIWCDWLRWHTIDPKDVVVPGFVAILKEARQGMHLALELGEDGKPYLDPKTGDAAKIVRTVQLESPPSDLPIPGPARAAPVPKRPTSTSRAQRDHH